MNDIEEEDDNNFTIHRTLVVHRIINLKYNIHLAHFAKDYFSELQKVTSLDSLVQVQEIEDRNMSVKKEEITF